jgi:alpha-mannosidase
MPEDTDGKRWIVRVYETEGKPTTAKLQLFKPASEAYYVDSNECKVSNGLSIRTDADSVEFEVPASSVVAVCLTFD